MQFQAFPILPLCGESFSAVPPISESSSFLNMPPSGASRVGASSGTANRVQFNPAIDLEMFSYVRNANPFRDPKEWTHIAAKMQDLTSQ